MNFSQTSLILDLLRKFNQMIQGIVTGPNCIDPEVCHGDCCFVNMEVPKALCDYYISHGMAEPENFVRSTMFSFKIAMDLQSMKCPFFSREINGCRVHFSGVKVPQCWVYPTGLESDPAKVEHSCKRAQGWDIVDFEGAKKTQEILNQYVSLCRQEAEFEQSLEQILNRLKNVDFKILSRFAPAHLSGLQDGWDSFEWLESENWNLGLKSICDSISCDFSYFECPKVCPSLKNLLQQELPRLVEKQREVHGYQNTLLFSDLFRFLSVR